MRRRAVLLGATGLSILGSAHSREDDKWGASRGYPTGLIGGLQRDPAYRVGNYSGGFEQMFSHHVIRATGEASPLSASPLKNFSYRWGSFKTTPDDYLERRAATGLLICRGKEVFVERYRMGRTADMRLTSWSMAKSVTSLLLGICLDRKLIKSFDDTADTYVEELRGTLHGSVTLRNLANMSSGVEVLHERDNPTIYGSALFSPQASVAKTIAGWNRRREEQGRTFNYNELCALTVGMVIRKAAGTSLAEFAQTQLWQPMGAEADATWLTDRERGEFNCIGFAARLRDWARLGLLIADRGMAFGRPVVSASWIHECTHWSEKDQQCRVGFAKPGAGYKAFMWHGNANGTWLSFSGNHGQRVLVDMRSRTVLVHTGVDHDGDWQSELQEVFNAATKI